MSEKKCMASQDGICRNVYSGGIRCNGYSKQCKLRPVYTSIQNAADGFQESLRKSFGIIGDRE